MRWHSIGRMRIVLAALAVLLLCCSPGIAQAATVSYDPATGLRYVAAPGERNEVTSETTFSGGEAVYVVRDTAGLTPGAGCTRGSSSEVVVCTTAQSTGGNMVITADLGDGDDTWIGTGFQSPTSDQFIFAGPGNDTVETLNANDNVDLGPGNDVAETRSGNDRVVGGAGDDRIFGGGGDDQLDGGPGLDTLDYSRGVGRLLLAQMDGTAPTQKNNGRDTIAGFEQLVGTDGFDTIVGTTGIDRIEGRGGGDRIYGDPAAFAANASAARASRLLQGGATCCFVVAGPARSAPTSPKGTPAKSRAVVRAVPDVPRELAVRIRIGDTLLGGTGRDLIFGSAGDDTINGEAGTDLIRAGDGIDLIFAREGEADDIRCGGGVDSITVDLRDVYLDTDRPAGQQSDCEQVDEGALKEHQQVILGPKRAAISGGALRLSVTCPASAGRQGCVGRLSASVGGTRGRTVSYRLAVRGRVWLRVPVPAGSGALELRSVERGRFGDKTMIRTLRR